LKKCENFCKNNYLIKINNVLKNSAKKYGNPYKPPTKEENEFAYNVCKKSFVMKNVMVMIFLEINNNNSNLKRK
jgi:hypothetical protein